MRSGDPIICKRKLMEDMDCDLRALTVHWTVLLEATRDVKIALDTLEEKRLETLDSLDTALSNFRPNNLPRPIPRLPVEVMAQIWQIYSLLPSAGTRNRVSPRRDLDETIVHERRILGDAAHFERYIDIELPQDDNNFLEDRLHLLRQCDRSRLCISLDIETFIDPTDHRYNQLDQCLFFSSQWDILTFHNINGVESIRKVLLRCAAAIPHIRSLFVDDPGSWNDDGIIHAGVLYMDKLQFADIPHQILSSSQLFSNVSELRLDIPTIRDAAAFYGSVLQNLPGSLQRLCLSDPWQLIHDDERQHDPNQEVTERALPFLKVLVIQGIKNFRALKIILPLFRRLSLQAFVISPVAAFCDEVLEQGLDGMRSVIQTIDVAFPSLSVMAVTANSIWSD